MAGEVSIEFDDSQWKAFLTGLQNKINKADKLLEVAFMTHGFADIIDHFRAESGPDTIWPERAESTQIAYQKISSGQWQAPRGAAAGAYDPGNLLLQLTGKLRKSLLRNPQAIKKIGKDAIKVFSNVEYSGRHDRGEGVPKREFMWLSDRAKERMAVTILDLMLGEELGQV